MNALCEVLAETKDEDEQDEVVPGVDLVWTWCVGCF